MNIVEEDKMKDFFDENFDFEEYSYFYHMTSDGVGELILERGLLMSDNDIYKTAIKIEESDIKDVDELLNSGTGSADFRKEMVLICTEKGNEQNLVKKNFGVSDSWVENDKADYIIYPENIIGFIKTDEKELYINDNCDYIDLSSKVY